MVKINCVEKNLKEILSKMSIPQPQRKKQIKRIPRKKTLQDERNELFSQRAGRILNAMGEGLV